MSTDIQIHDSVVLGYEVDSEERTIKFRTEYRDGGGAKIPNPKRADVIFKKVAAYEIINDSLGTILYDIAEVDPNEIVEKNLKRFENSYNLSGWPGQWAVSKESAQKYFKNNLIRGYWIDSSIGLSGWVLAKDLEFILVP